MGVATMIAQFFLSLSILVILHEFGHFLPAKLFKTKVEKFYLFFNPWFSLFKVKKGETEYGVGWLPLGGYVKIAGMIDESMDKEQMKKPPQPWEFRSKPAWQRLVIMLGGVTVNFILGGVIFGLMLFTWGESYLPPDKAIYGVHVDSIGEEIGLQEGDKVLGAGGIDFLKTSDRELVRAVVLDGARDVKVERDGREIIVPIEEKYAQLFTKATFRSRTLYTARHPFVVEKFTGGSPAEEAGIIVGDKIVGINDIPTPFYLDFAKVVTKMPGEQVTVKVERGGQTLSIPMTLSEKGKIGAFTQLPETQLEYNRQSYSLFKAIPAGFVKGYDFLADQINAFGQMFSGKINPNDSLGGFGTISGLFPQTWDWEAFWNVTAILSLILGFMNLLPIPALDGGHVMFLLWEVVTGRKPSDKFMEYATLIGFILIIGLVLYANGLDFLRWWNR